jgi:hypothetical protein
MNLGHRLSTLRFLIHDRDPVLTAAFAQVFRPEDCGSSSPSADAPDETSGCILHLFGAIGG